MHLRPGLVAVVSATAVVVVSAAAPPVLLESLAGRQVFPATNWWNQDVSAAPLDPGSAQFVSWIGATRQLHPDFGPPPYGIPYVVVAGDQARVPVTFDYGDESDTGVPGLPGYPIPDEAQTQPHLHRGRRAWRRHVRRPPPADHRSRSLAALRDVRDASGTRRRADGRPAPARSSILSTNDRRPDTWTSADAAGLAILPGLVRYDDVFGAGEITHAFRFTTRATNGYVWPASHRAGSTAGAPPMGTRLRMKASQRHLRLSARNAEDLPRDEALRPDPGGQRLRHVHHRDDGRAVEQRACSTRRSAR